MIDGFHGLAGLVVIIILGAIAILNWQAGDTLMVHISLAAVGAIVGFLFLNYPSGRLFLGDGGAYLAGFMVGELAVLTIARNPSINAWQVLAICGYPVIEVVFSIYRKKLVRKSSPMMPDRLHFHMLVYRRLVCQLLKRKDSQPWARNSAVVLVIGAPMLAAVFLVISVGDVAGTALAVLGLEAFAYMTAYARLVRGHWCWRPSVVFGLRPEIRPTR
jgi:UDP-N-acetylmuramyl pentapeptide phosphotransferase/UDP-N-acetylglucosamine-1-phosphate transferase